MSEWIKAIQEHVKTNGIDKVPPGWKTFNEVMKEIKRAESQTHRILKALVAAGKAEERRFKAITSNGSVRSLMYYKLK